MRICFAFDPDENKICRTENWVHTIAQEDRNIKGIGQALVLSLYVPVLLRYCIYDVEPTSSAIDFNKTEDFTLKASSPSCRLCPESDGGL